MDWNVIYVKSRTEKKVEAALLKLGIKAYCPLVTETHQWSDRKKKVQVPILKSYVFVQPSAKELDMVFQVPHVVQYLFWLGKRAVVKDHEITTMQNWLSTSTNIQPLVETLQPGDHITIKTGPFKGKKGCVKELGKNRIQILLLDLDIKITLDRN
ncbi:UpxY family transcription antiterminator [Algibacter pacificus]|uniref:UpxY family transcription antiterminator n=1 Tax=Algibacter pacificus TaxID=2599389 RepID=UPI0011C78ECE|nr:UpxY family transcription antiterminator [Algibacter pacificus]